LSSCLRSPCRCRTAQIAQSKSRAMSYKRRIPRISRGITGRAGREASSIENARSRKFADDCANSALSVCRRETTGLARPLVRHWPAGPDRPPCNASPPEILCSLGLSFDSAEMSINLGNEIPVGIGRRSGHAERADGQKSYCCRCLAIGC
jgi:hypothetical protein